MDEPELSLRLVVERPMPGVAVGMQSGRGATYDLISPTRIGEDVAFDFTLRVIDGDPPVLRGDVAQGPPAARFVYVNWGKSAGQFLSPWTRRAKIPLAGITRALARTALGAPGARLEARVAGVGKDGGPAAASVKLLDGWRLGTEDA